MTASRLVACQRCAAVFRNHRRKAEPYCTACRLASAASTGSDHADHRLDVVVLRLGAGGVRAVLDGLESEGFLVAGPGNAAVPSEWLATLIKLADPETDLMRGRGFTDDDGTRVGQTALRDHIRSLPAVARVTLSSKDADE